MKLLIIIALLAASSYKAVGQGTFSGNVSIEGYRTVKDLELKMSIEAKDLFGVFKLQAGSYLWFYLTLDSNMTFRIHNQDCINRTSGEVGTWSISFNRVLTLHLPNQQIIFDVLQWRSNLYLVEPVNRKNYIERIRERTYLLELDYYHKAIR